MVVWQADWLAGVVVDSLDFKVTKMVVKDRPQQLDRTTDILNDPPKKRAFKKVRNAHLPSGKVSPPTQATPRSLHRHCHDLLR